MVFSKPKIMPFLVLAAALSFYALTQPGLSTIRLFSKSFAVSAVILLSVSLAIGPLARLWPKAQPLVAHRKYWGIVGFVFGLLHAALAFYDPLLFSAQLALSRQNVRLGLMALVVFALLTATSNAWAMRKLGGKNWKRLQQLGYLGLLLVGLDLLVLADGTFSRTPLGAFLAVLVFGTLAIAAIQYIRELKCKAS